MPPKLILCMYVCACAHACVYHIKTHKPGLSCCLMRLWFALRQIPIETAKSDTGSATQVDGAQ